MKTPRLARMRAKRVIALEKEMNSKVDAHGLLVRVRFHIEDDVFGWDEARREAWRVVGKLIEELDHEAMALCDELLTAKGALIETGESGRS